MMKKFCFIKSEKPKEAFHFYNGFINVYKKF